MTRFNSSMRRGLALLALLLGGAPSAFAQVGQQQVLVALPAVYALGSEQP